MSRKKYESESNADLWWEATSRLEVLSKRLKDMGEHNLSALVESAVKSMHTVAKEMEK